jgi:hypothetical protein
MVEIRGKTVVGKVGPPVEKELKTKMTHPNPLQ